MSDDRTTTTTTPAPQTTVIETRGGGGSGVGLMIGFVLLLAVAIGAFYLITQNNHQSNKDAAITQAAKSVEKTADKAGEAIDQATKK